MLDYLCYDLIVRLLRSSKPKKLLLGDASLDKNLKNANLQIQRPYFLFKWCKTYDHFDYIKNFQVKTFKTKLGLLFS